MVEVKGNGSIWVWYGTEIFAGGLFICSFGTNTGGRISSSGGVILGLLPLGSTLDISTLDSTAWSTQVFEYPREYLST